MNELNCGLDVELTGKALEIEARFVPVCAELNSTPIRVDAVALDRELTEAKSVYSALETLLWEETKNPKFRPNAAADCEALFKAKGEDLSRKTATGRTQMDKAVLTRLARIHPVAKNILLARDALSKLGQLRKWHELFDPVVTPDLRVQPTWHQFGTPMGRMSCEAPALQNRVTEIRRTVVPEDGYVFLSVDLKQAEYRTWANLSADRNLVAIFRDPTRDLHQEMGQLVAPFFPGVVDVRKVGKTLNFAMLYMMSIPTLAEMLGTDLDRAQLMADKYYERSPEAMGYMRTYVMVCEKTGGTATDFGRRRVLPGLSSPFEEIRRESVKTAWHHHNAGTTADYVKWMMAEVHEELLASPLKEKTRWALNMHDQFVLQVHRSVVEEVTTVVERVMAKPIFAGLTAPYAYDLVVGSTWAEIDA